VSAGEVDRDSPTGVAGLAAGYREGNCGGVKYGHVAFFST
jgi:hypothetical protein